MEEIINWIMDEHDWFHDGFDAFIRLANRLHKLGMEEEEIKEHLKDIYQAVANEYGD